MAPALEFFFEFSKILVQGNPTSTHFPLHSSPTSPPQFPGDPLPCSYQVAHRELLAEAEFYQLAGLCELLRGRLLELEDKGERLRRLSIDTAIADTRGGFDSLLSQIYAEMEGKAAQARAAL
jgi:hypothetical protein